MSAKKRLGGLSAPSLRPGQSRPETTKRLDLRLTYENMPLWLPNEYFGCHFNSAALPGSGEELKTYNLKNRSSSVENCKIIHPGCLGVFGPVPV